MTSEEFESITIKSPKLITAKLVESSIIVFDHENATFLYSGGKYYGKPIGTRKPKNNLFFARPLELSFLEGLYLHNKGKLQIFGIDSKLALEADDIIKFGEKYTTNFLDKYEIYEDLRDKGYIVRPGLKFGADFAVYKQGPGLDHSPYIIQIVPKSANLNAIDIVRAGRLANSVKKRFIIANALSRTYYGFKWFKP